MEPNHKDDILTAYAGQGAVEKTNTEHAQGKTSTITRQTRTCSTVVHGILLRGRLLQHLHRAGFLFLSPSIGRVRPSRRLHETAPDAFLYPDKKTYGPGSRTLPSPVCVMGMCYTVSTCIYFDGGCAMQRISLSACIFMACMFAWSDGAESPENKAEYVVIPADAHNIAPDTGEDVGPALRDLIEGTGAAGVPAKIVFAKGAYFIDSAGLSEAAIVLSRSGLILSGQGDATTLSSGTPDRRVSCVRGRDIWIEKISIDYDRFLYAGHGSIVNQAGTASISMWSPDTPCYRSPGLRAPRNRKGVGAWFLIGTIQNPKRVPPILST